MYFRSAILILVWVLFVSGTPRLAESNPSKYYISSNSDDQNQGTITKPWKSLQNIRIENNTVLRIKKHEGYNDFFWFNEDFKANKVYFRNNIFVIGDGIPPIYYHGDGTVQHHDHNLYYCIDGKTFENGETYNVLGTPLGKGEIIANP